MAHITGTVAIIIIALHTGAITTGTIAIGNINKSAPPKQRG